VSRDLELVLLVLTLYAAGVRYAREGMVSAHEASLSGDARELVSVRALGYVNIRDHNRRKTETY
jgi:hypothetical protein